MQIVVDGEAAKAVCSLARHRWRNATGELLEECSRKADLWPRNLIPDFTDIFAAVARTAPRWGNEPAVREAAALTADALVRAQKVIYIETQYMTASYVGDCLAETLARETGPEIIIVMTHASRGLVERFIMGRNRDRLIRRLKRADRFGRFRAFYPLVSLRDRNQQILVHSKVIIVDDLFLRVRSSNLNNRSIGLDTECDIAIEATTAAARASIARIRNELLAEHLGTTAQIVAAKGDSTGSMIAAAEGLNNNARCLHPFEAMPGDGPTRPVFGTRLFDPKRPFEPLWFLRRRKPPRNRSI
jgi:phosphatidylserine/phosphatidylglycerophosphate/cardiolipin synthase-like enzyme